MPIIAPGASRPPDARAARRRLAIDRVLIWLLLAALTAWLVRAHWEAIDAVHLKDKLALHEQVLQNTAPDPYQYKLWPLTRAMEDIRGIADLWLEFVFYGNTLLSLLFLVVVHHLWLRAYASPKTALLGGILMGALANVLFLNYWHHPYEFWGVGLYCLLLQGMAKDWRLVRLVPLAFVAGFVWEKHAVLAVIWVLWSLQRRRPFGKTALGGLAILVASLAVPIALRFLLGTDRDHVDGTTTWSVQPWGRVAWTMAPYVLPFLLILILRWRVVPAWVRWLWLAVPLAYAAYLSQSYILHEVRSFWLFVPVFTATFCAWIGAHETTPAEVATPPA